LLLLADRPHSRLNDLIRQGLGEHLGPGLQKLLVQGGYDAFDRNLFILQREQSFIEIAKPA